MPNSANLAAYYATPRHSQRAMPGLGTYIKECHRHYPAASIACKGFTTFFLCMKSVIESIEDITLR